MSVGNNRLPLVREACASGKYNAIVLLGGGDPGYMEAREIARQYRIPLTSSAHAQMHIAGLLGNKFSIVDISESHNMQMYHLVVQYRMTDRCASIRNVNFPLPTPNHPNDKPFNVERDRALQSGTSDMLDAAVEESVAAIEEDGADTIILGCSAAFWMQPLLQKRLLEIGWDVPVLEGARAAIQVAKMLSISASTQARSPFPASARPSDGAGRCFSFLPDRGPPGPQSGKTRRGQDDRQTNTSRRNGGAFDGRRR